MIQHSDIATQERYLPMMKDAVKEGKAMPQEIALLEDRIAVRRGRNQVYGSQVGKNMSTGSYYVFPLEDPENVDKRRAEVKLPPLNEYLSQWGINWSIDQYYKDLRELNNPVVPKTNNRRLTLPDKSGYRDNTSR